MSALAGSGATYLQIVDNWTPPAKEAQHVQIEAIRVANPDDTAAGVWAISRMLVPGPVVPVPDTPAPPQRARVAAVPGTWLPLLSQYAWPVAESVAVMTCESSGRPNAENGTSIGLFQINIAAHPYTVEQMRDPAQNVAAAFAIWSDQGWGPWACQP